MSEVNNTKAYPSDIPIECAKTRKCGWQGMESDMKSIPHPTIKIASQLVCPKCGETGYYRREPK